MCEHVFSISGNKISFVVCMYECMYKGMQKMCMYELFMYVYTVCARNSVHILSVSSNLNG